MKECFVCWQCFDDNLQHCPNDNVELRATQPVSTIIVDRYQLERRLGQGGTAAVYLARELDKGTAVAIKLLHYNVKQKLSHTDQRRFELEASALQKIHHSNIITVLDYGLAAEGLGYLAMELLEGHSLEAEFKRSPVLAILRSLEIVEQICQAMGAAHQAGILHRDLKPSNIFLHITGDGREIVKILDFGLAKVISARPEDRLTGRGIIVGTPQYMSPEQCEGRELDERSDIYAVAVMLYRALTGKPPFNASSRIETIQKQLFSLPTPLQMLNPAVPIAIQEVVMCALAKSPAHRYPDMAAFWEALATARAEYEQTLAARRQEASREQPSSERSSTRRLRRLDSD
ncbi:MAG: serine/threonine-protein kinase [Acidobacteriota bacterium]